MRILVISDLHGRKSNFERVMEKHPDVKRVIFLGDGVEDVEELASFFPDKDFTLLSGNCDFFSKYPSTVQLDIEGTKLIATHGHTYNVKSGTVRLREAAMAGGITLALYGHTHVPKVEYEEGVYIVCPGALGNSVEGGPSYAIIDVTKQGIMPNLLKL